MVFALGLVHGEFGILYAPLGVEAKLFPMLAALFGIAGQVVQFLRHGVKSVGKDKTLLCQTFVHACDFLIDGCV